MRAGWRRISANRQHTLAAPTRWVAGRELQSGARTRVRLLPAPAGSGVRYALGHAVGDEVVLDSVPIPATLATVSNRDRCLCVERQDVIVTNVEHLNAVLLAFGIDNVLVVLEKRGLWCKVFKRQALPLLDDSTAGFVDAVEAVGLQEQDMDRERRTVSEPFELRDPEKGDFLRVEPGPGLRLSCTGGYEHVGIPECTWTGAISGPAFRDEVSRARTLMNQQMGVPLGVVRFAARFAFLRYGLGTGISQASMLLMHQGALRGDALYGGIAEEFVRHKVIDFLGALALLGPLADCHFTVVKSSHRHDLAFLRALEPRLHAIPRSRTAAM